MQMSYVDSNLVPGETVVYETRLHWVVVIGHIIVGCLLLALPGVLLLVYALGSNGLDRSEVHLMESGGAALLVIGVVVMLVGWVRRNATDVHSLTRAGTKSRSGQSGSGFAYVALQRSIKRLSALSDTAARCSISPPWVI